MTANQVQLGRAIIIIITAYIIIGHSNCATKCPTQKMCHHGVHGNRMVGKLV